MKLGTDKTDPWRQILNNLRELRAPEPSRQRSAANTLMREVRPHSRTIAPPSINAAARRELSCCVRINVLDRDGGNATIAWHDPTMCHYDDQRWHRAKASRKGICAMTGALIEPGSDIFRPSHVKPKPVNADAMILSSAIPETIVSG